MNHQQIVAATADAWARLVERHPDLPPGIPVAPRMNVRGRVAGRVAHRGCRGARGWYVPGTAEVVALEFNPTLAERAGDVFVNTVTHEVAHVAAVLLFGHIGHGDVWRRLHRSIGGNGERCHTYDTGHLPPRRRMRRWNYTCGCKTWPLTTVRHNKILAGTVYRCPSCRGVLK